MKFTKDRLNNFQKIVWDYYDVHRREMPWRKTDDPYKIMVSELMLQQTQVKRVIPKYETFIQSFPDVASLAEAPQSSVIKLWSGLGYNRRAQYLHESAKKIVNEWNGVFPDSQVKLAELKGIGENTAGAIIAYSFNKPTIFIETNIRAAIIHFFYKDEEAVTDKEIKAVLEEVTPEDNPREWYWALMDYGAYIKKTHGNPARKSTMYSKQSRFEGSFRQVRGEIIKLLTKNDAVKYKDIIERLQHPRVDEAIKALEAENLVLRTGDTIKLQE